MSTRIDERMWGLTEREKQTLRLMVRGHDAKSIARSLGLSVHTVNERLRDARRKVQVSSSREAARLLLDAEGAEAGTHPDLLGDREIGADRPGSLVDQEAAPVGARRSTRPWFIIGGLAMSFAIALLALAAVSQPESAPAAAPTTSAQAGTEVTTTARQWLELLDEGRWDDSYRGTGTAFQKLNSLAVWTEVSERVRTPLGAVRSRQLLSQENLPAPPAGYEVVKFRTLYAGKTEPVVETVTLERENDRWMVVGVTVG